MITSGVPLPQTIVGLVSWGEAEGIAGQTQVLFDPATAFELYSVDGGFATIIAAAVDGIDDQALIASVTQAVGADVEVLTGAEVAADTDLGADLGFITTAMLAFAGVSLFVGAFIIANTFSITVAQRTRQLALLRAVGASRRQVLASVLGEGAAIGILGSIAGVAAGIAVAVGLRSLLDAFGLTLPEGDLVITGSTIAIGLVVGTVVTTLSAVGSAIRSVRVPPVAAMQAVAVPPPARSGRIRTILGVLTTLAGIALIAVGLIGDAGIAAVGGGAVVVILGVALLATFVARPVVAALGAPLTRLLGIRGDLAAQNASRNPRRTASTASALMIGLGLVSFVLIFGASLTASTAAIIEGSFVADLSVRSLVQSETAAGAVSEELPDELAALEQVDVAVPLRVAELRYADGAVFAAGVDPARVEQVLSLDAVDGAWADLAAGGVALKADLAATEGLTVGDVVQIDLGAGPRDLVLRTIFDGEIDVSWIVDEATLLEDAPFALIGQVLVRYTNGADAVAARAAVDDLLASYPTVTAFDAEEFTQSIKDLAAQLVGLMTIMLLLSVLIALFGLVNTLSLSVYERTRELGLLRAVGATRQQIRAIVRWEAVLISALGAALGLGIGTLFGWMAVKALADEGFSHFALPGGQLAIGLVAAGIAGVVAAIGPARRAARTDVLTALQMQ